MNNQLQKWLLSGASNRLLLLFCMKGPIKQRTKTSAWTLKIAGCTGLTQCSPPEHCVIILRACYLFRSIAIFIGIPSGSLCGGESRTAVLQKLLNIRFSYKHCFRLPSYSARWLPKPWQGLLVFNVLQWAPTWEKFASRRHLIFKFPFHYYCVHLLLFLTLIALILNRFPDENAETIKIR